MLERKKLDATDKGILRALAEDPQAPNVRLADLLGVSEVTIAARIEALIKAKVMKITVQRDMRTLGYEVFGLVLVSVAGREVREVARRIGDLPQVFSVTILLGAPQIMVMLMSSDTRQFSRLIEEQIGPIPGVMKATSSLVLDVIDFKPGIAALT